ncbi:hypothetical protein LXD80_13630 [Enterobacter sp. ASE]|uniref:hypothetical protein n=1 Tax=Enterobacter sp. ASE TaxID=2905968 RepID=UPI001E3F58C8|nr:hypothetical protein [Enterobacter sp. ASE]MCE3116834.1 hypothetical protein [Enterobacter sp. ASE]
MVKPDKPASNHPKKRNRPKCEVVAGGGASRINFSSGNVSGLMARALMETCIFIQNDKRRDIYPRNIVTYSRMQGRALRAGKNGMFKVGMEIDIHSTLQVWRGLALGLTEYKF